MCVCVCGGGVGSYLNHILLWTFWELENYVKVRI